jgi:hypothetical protein
LSNKKGQLPSHAFSEQMLMAFSTCFMRVSN